MLFLYTQMLYLVIANNIHVFRFFNAFIDFASLYLVFDYDGFEFFRTTYILSVLIFRQFAHIELYIEVPI